MTPKEPSTSWEPQGKSPQWPQQWLPQEKQICSRHHSDSTRTDSRQEDRDQEGE